MARHWCNECQAWRKATPEDEEPDTLTEYTCDTCGEAILCDECGQPWSAGHTCDASNRADLAKHIAAASDDTEAV